MSDLRLWPAFGGVVTLGFLALAGGTRAAAVAAGPITPAAAGACVPSAVTLCIDDQAGDRRWQVSVSFHTAEGGGRSGNGNAIALGSLGVAHGGLFWFFSGDNPEMLIKVLDGCGVNGQFWVFYAAGTNVGFTVTVTDTHNGRQRTYVNVNGTAALPLQDTSALACP